MHKIVTAQITLIPEHAWQPVPDYPDTGVCELAETTTNEVVQTINVGQSASGVAAGAGGVWVPVPLEDRVKRIDPATNAITDTGTGARAGPARWRSAPAPCGSPHGARGTVTRIDPTSARVTDTVRRRAQPSGRRGDGGSRVGGGPGEPARGDSRARGRGCGRVDACSARRR